MASRKILPLIRQARAGDATSQFELGKLYLDGGQGLGANQHSALLWLDRAALQGHAPAWRLIGQRVSPAIADNVQLSRNLIQWYELASNEGCTSAQTKLAQLLLSSRHAGDAGNPTDRAIALLRGAAASGDPTARFELGIRLLRNQAANVQDANQAIQLLEQAYAAGRRAAARHLAGHYWRASNAELAYLWYSRGVDIQDAELCYRLGTLRTLFGEPGGNLLERAAALHHPLACEELGLRYAIGWCRDADGALGSRNFKKAVRMLERAASVGSAKACFFLALLYNHRNCSFRSLGKAREWLFEAARRGHAEAQYRAGARLQRDVDYARATSPQETGSDDPDVAAIRFLAEAARKGHSQAAAALDAAGCRAPRHAEAQAFRWEQAVASMASLSEPVAARLELAYRFGLRICELIMIDPVQAYHGDCFVIDVSNAAVKLRRRIVLVEHEAQRDAADKAKSLFRGSGPVPGDLHGGRAARYQQLIRRCARNGIDLHQLRQCKADMLFPQPARGDLAKEEVGATPLSLPFRRSASAASNDRFAPRTPEM